MNRRRDFTRIVGRGFTLVEILVVIAIIGILASIIMASLSTARAKGRDAKRLSDIKQIQLALELFYDACGNYPANIYNTANNTCSASGATGVGLVQGGYISVVPYDPTASTPCTDGTQSSCYAYVGICAGSGSTGGACTPISYHLGATLETNDPSLQQDPDACPGGTAGQQCTSGQGNYHDGPASNLSNWYNQNGGDFYGQSTGSSGECLGPIGTAYPGTERCFDAVP
jgi:prepilin-type N-terminal cleavage/methylation domain-containing protein